MSIQILNSCQNKILRSRAQMRKERAVMMILFRIVIVDKTVRVTFLAVLLLKMKTVPEMMLETVMIIQRYCLCSRELKTGKENQLKIVLVQMSKKKIGRVLIIKVVKQ